MFRCEPRAGVLLFREQEVTLPTRIIDVLLTLLRAGGTAVSKQTILRAVWPDHFVSEDSLTKAVSQLRKSLSRYEPGEYIRTVPGVGYRFAVPVQTHLLEDTGLTHKTSTKIDLLVWPFEIIGDQPTTATLIADEIVALIAGTEALSELAVINGTGLTCGLDETRREHLPRLVIRGSMQVAANKTVRVTVQLLNGDSVNTIDADSSTLRKTHTASRPLMVARMAIKLLLKNIKGATAAQSDKKAGAAFESFAKAQYFWKQRNVQGLRQAIRFATQATAEDPEFAPAYVLLANCYATLISHGEGIPVQLLLQAKEAVETALKVDPNLVVAHVALANLNVRFELDWVAAEANYRHALDREPRSVLAHHWYGNALIAAGRFNEGIRSIESAFLLQPSSLSIRTARAQAYYLAGYVAECQRQLEDILDMNPAFTPAYFGLGMTHGAQGRANESLAMFRRAAKLSGGKSFYLASLACAHTQWGQKRQARKILQHLQKLASKCYVPYYDLALLHACIGNNEKAVEMFGQAVDNRDALVMWMKVDPRLDSLRKEGSLRLLLSRFRLSSRRTATTG